MISRLRVLSVTALLAMVITLTLACGSQEAIKSFQLALASSGPLIESLVVSGALPKSKATDIIRDFDDGTVCALTLASDFKRIPKDDPNARSRKLSASVNAMRCWRTIVARQNFALHPRIQQAATIADGILASLVIFYSEPGEMRSDVSATEVRRAPSEDELEKQLRVKVKQLEQTLKP